MEERRKPLLPSGEKAGMRGYCTYAKFFFKKEFTITKARKY